MMVIVMLELSQLSLQVAGIPEKCVVKILATNGSDQSFYERMGEWNIWNAFYLLDIQDTKVCFPSVVLEEWIVVRAKILGGSHP